MISVVIPLYNKAQSITHTLDSVLAQTYTNYEVVVVNDGSTDGSDKVVEDYIKSSITNHQSQIRLINQPNGGVCSARNRGIHEALGEYIAFLDADDLWEPTYLETLYNLITDYPHQGIYLLGCAELFKGQQPAPILHPRRGIVDNPWANPVNWSSAGSSCCSSKALLIKMGGFDTRMTHGEDLDMWWRLALHSGVAVDERATLAYYCQDAENRAMHRYIPFEKHIPFYIEKYTAARATNSDFRTFFDKQMIYRLYPYLFESSNRKEAKRLAKLIDYTPFKWSMHFRMICPHLYRLYERLKNIL